MKRRDFLKSGAVAMGVVAGHTGLLLWTPRAEATTITMDLNIVSGDITMADDTQAYIFSFSQSGLPELPGPTLICQEGDTIVVNLTNNLATQTSFVIGGTDTQTTIAANSSTTLSFQAPTAGTYLYYDGLNEGVNRVMGLHGALVVMPAGLKNQSFVGGPSFVRQYKWVLSNIDKRWGEEVKLNGDDFVTNPALSVNSFEPNYFTVNGDSYAKTHNSNTELMGNVGEPALVRMLNAGMATHSLHYHGNHVDIISINQQNFPVNPKRKDVIPMFPLDVRDGIFPFESPRDAWPPVDANDPQHYPMHCHTELSQTAGGGSYPHGMHCAIVIGQAPATESELTQSVAALP